MNDIRYLCISIAVMALVTYLIRMLPLAVFRKKIENRFVLDFLYYVPYAVLTAMTIPSVFYSSSSILSAAAGFIVAVVLAFFERGLLTVAVCACAGVFVTELLMGLPM
ncbi:MAG: AzlD domain-containing protein [Oscillospiraceae bacterium]|nr:AzlD domain-containing protein [Oscillospiraceae bacterium]